MNTKQVLLAFSSISILAACGTPAPSLKDAQYWQRKDTTSALYLQGPKAQQTLHQDIARCASDITELENLGAIREGTPADHTESRAVDPDKPHGRLKIWETPKRDGYLRAEHLEYHDFETCMDYKGWERIKHVPYEVSERAKSVWLDTVEGAKHQSKYGHAPASHDDGFND